MAVRLPSSSCRSAFAAAVALICSVAPTFAQECRRTVTADVVALDQVVPLNRFGAVISNGMIFALKRDVVDTASNQSCATVACKAGAVRLRNTKRPRPLVLRANVGDCLDIRFTNLLAKTPKPPQNPDPTRNVGVHVMGLELRGSINSDGSWVGQNPGPPNGLTPPDGGTNTYRYYARKEGASLLYSLDFDLNAVNAGLFGSVNVQPWDAEWYRSQVTREDLIAATYDADNLPPNMHLTPKLDAAGKPSSAMVDGQETPLWILTTFQQDRQTLQTATVIIRDRRLYTPGGHPIVNYQATQPDGTPILSMTRRNQDGTLEIVYGDLTAIITGKDAGRFEFSNTSETFGQIPSSPDRREPYREFSIHYHQNGAATQFWSAPTGGTALVSPALANALTTGADAFGINYGMGGIGAEILANRLNVGPSAGCVECKYEEFFLSSWAVGDPAMVVDVPANQGLTKSKLKATKALYPDDPSNVYHSYLRDHTKFRIHNVGPQSPHVHHQHAHQWLRTPNDSNAHYLDSQMIIPGASYTLEMSYNGSGNRNGAVGDSIFHCHFYPHFAAGMWSLWRVHDAFEAGTAIDPDGRPTAGWNRALPDGEIERGTPIPAVVPLPTLGMAPIAPKVQLTENGRRACVLAEGEDPTQACGAQPSPAPKTYRNPGFPFFVPGLAGRRPPHPPLDFAWEEEKPGAPRLTATGSKVPLDGGLPRHQALRGSLAVESHTRWDFTKDFILYANQDKSAACPVDPQVVAGDLLAYRLPEDGTLIEQAAMRFHSQRTHQASLPDGDAGAFVTNGLPPAPGAPFAAPDVDDFGNSVVNTRRYQAAVIQKDVQLNKAGWHYPQQRFITLWNDVAPTMAGKRPAQPFFIRANSGESIEFWHTNLVPNYYEVDDFQVRTPTDIIGQHIHLVKFDVLASDGAANGFNYEDGTFSPDEVRERIDAINVTGGLFAFDESCWTSSMPIEQCLRRGQQMKLAAKPAQAIFGTPPAGQNWCGAQTTIQRFDTDPLQNTAGEDRTLRTVFTHDHFGPSTHQQVGLYAGLLIEPEGSRWLDPITGEPYYDVSKRSDGGPTSWQANIITPDPADSFREFALEFQDLQLAYVAPPPGSPTVPANLFTTQALFTTAGNYASALNQGGPVPAGLAAEFSQNGITLTGKAVVTVVKPNASWTVRDPGKPDKNESYRIDAATSTTQNVFTPNIPPGFANPTLAISAPSGGSLFTCATNLAPCPTIISNTGGTFSLNYRNEPLPLRVVDGQNKPAPNPQGDLSYVFNSMKRAADYLNTQPTPLLVPGMMPFDPFTPLLRAYQNDKVQIRTLVGAHTSPHSFNLHGLSWLSEPQSPNSGYRSAQGMGLSEHFEMLFTVPQVNVLPNAFADYLYNASLGTSALGNPLWGIMRAYDGSKGILPDLQPLPNNPKGGAPVIPEPVCPKPDRQLTVVAVAVCQLMGGCDQSQWGKAALVYNSRGQVTQLNPVKFDPTTPIQDPNALIFLEQSQAEAAGQELKAATALGPLVLRAAAGECVEITLKNAFKPDSYPFDANYGASLPANLGRNLPAITLQTSAQAGLQPQGVSYSVTESLGLNAGFNVDQTVTPGKNRTMRFYAGKVSRRPDGTVERTPVEFGTLSLMSSDPLLHHAKGLIGTLIIEPQGSTWQTDGPGAGTASATVTRDGVTLFREFVTMFQADAETCTNPQGKYTCTINTGALNYRSEPQSYRYPPKYAGDLSAFLSNTQVNGDPQTPIFTVAAGTPVRMRVLYPSGAGGARVFSLHGHSWPDRPFVDGSTRIDQNPLSQYVGSQQITPNETLQVVAPSAGGSFCVPGDYLIHFFASESGGAWGIMRVGPPDSSKSTACPK